MNVKTNIRKSASVRCWASRTDLMLIFKDSPNLWNSPGVIKSVILIIIHTCFDGGGECWIL